MAKRFTDTQKWKRPWFRQLPAAYKLLWIYICDECDIAGTWYVDIGLASYLIGEKIELEEARTQFTKQITELDEGTRWQIRDFAAFQYGDLTPTNNLHKAVIWRLDAIASRSSSAPNQPQNSPSRGAKEKDKEKDGVVVKAVGGSGGFSFEAIWNRYPRRLGRKAAERHFKTSVVSPQDWLDIQNALDNFKRQMAKERREDDKVPYGSTWFNNWRDWINYAEEKHGSHDGTSIHSYGAIAERAREIRRTQGLRKVSATSAGKILAGVRTDAVDSPPGAGTENREPVRE